MQSVSVSADVITYSIRISTCEKGQHGSARSGFRSRCSRPASPRTSSLTREQQCAVWLLESMQSVSVPANVITYNASISACEGGQQWQSAVWLLASIQSVSVPAKVNTYIASISACKKGQQW